MKKPPLTPEQKAWKKRRDTLQILHNRILSKISFKQITTQGEYFTESGRQVPEGIDGKLALSEEFWRGQMQRERDELEEYIRKEQDAKNGVTMVQTEPSTKQQVGMPSTEQSATTILPQSTNERSPVSPSVESQLARTESKATDTALTRKEFEEEFIQNEQNNYGLVDSKNWDVFHYWFQKKAIAQAWRKTRIEKKHGILIVSSTGTGKTFMCGALARKFEDEKFYEGLDLVPPRPRTISHIPYLYVTRSSIVTQTERVLKKHYKMGVEQMEVINIEQLRSAAGRLWVTEKMDIVNGKEEWTWKWKELINPCVIFWDECQALKNESSTQHEIACAFNDLKNPETYQFFVSATPFTRVIEAKCWAVSTRRNIEHLGFPKGTVLSNATWPAYAAAIAAPAKPYEYNESAVERLMKDLDDYVVRVKGVKPQFEAINSTQLIDFQSKEEEDFYRKAWDRYVEEKKKLEAIALAEGRDISSTGINELVAFQKFRMAAEVCRKEYLAKEMYDIVQNKKKAAICALNFKGSIIAVVKILVDKYKVPRNQISLIWGGGQTELTAKQKNKKKILDLKDKFEAMGMGVEELLTSLGLDDVEERIVEELDPSLRLGTQSAQERQSEIDKFQSGKSLYCFYTFRAGGVGLSLHHSDEQIPIELQRSAISQLEKIDDPLVKEILRLYSDKKDPDGLAKARKLWSSQGGRLDEGSKLNLVLALGCRRKESGYAVEEDIPNVPIRPRESLIAPTYSAIELVQGLGRAPRLTSLSDTVQRLIFYRHSIEKDVAAIVALKLKCLGPVVKQREAWMDVATNHYKKDELTAKHLAAIPRELIDRAEREHEQPEMVEVGDE